MINVKSSANLLYPREDKNAGKLEFACRTCYYSEDAETTCIFRNELTNQIGDTAGITQDIGEDPTVGNNHDYDLSEDPNADFYASAQSSSAPSPNAKPSIVPDFCTMCGQEVFCEFCGEPSDRGCFLEVDEDQAGQFGGMQTPKSLTRSSTADMMESSQSQLQQLRLQPNNQGGGGSTGS